MAARMSGAKRKAICGAKIPEVAVSRPLIRATLTVAINAAVEQGNFAHLSAQLGETLAILERRLECQARDASRSRQGCQL